MKLTDLPAELLAACLARACGGDPAALLDICAAHPALLRQFRRALGFLEQLWLDISMLQRLGQSVRGPDRYWADEQARCRKLTDLLWALACVKTLTLYDMHLADEHLAAIGILSQLTRLSLFGCKELPDGSLEHLCRLPNLQALNLGYASDVGRAQALQRMHTLRELCIGGCAKIPSTSLLPIASNLRVLKASSCSKLTNALCQRLTSCEELDLSYTRVNAEGLQLLAQHAPKLRRLRIHTERRKVSKQDLDAFRACRPDVQLESD